jgi:uncharacterized protein (TIGR01777 family)
MPLQGKSSLKTRLFQKRSIIPAPVDEVFAWHERPGALERLSPPWDTPRVIRHTGGIRPGTEVTLKMKAGPIPYTWQARHEDYQPNRFFSDIQIRGPFAVWRHSHRFSPEADASTVYEDTIEYALPFPGRWFGFTDRIIQQKLNHIFRYRHATLAADLADHLKTPNPSPMTILVSGGSGLMGASLIPYLTTGGHRVIRLVRRQPRPGHNEIFWDPAAGRLDGEQLDGIDAVIHLSGENIGEGRWTAEKKQRIVDSRTKTTALLANTIAALPHPPRVFACASAIGYYGNRGDAVMTEADSPGDDFISYVCRQWEEAAAPAQNSGIRTVFLRIGIVLTPAGAALKKLLVPFHMGLGGKIGDGNQYMSWISMDDAVSAIRHCLVTPGLEGPVNIVSPQPAPNREFAATLGKVLSRPDRFPVPAAAIKLAFGQMGCETVLSGVRVTPARLLDTGFCFRHPDLETALRHLIGKP